MKNLIKEFREFAMKGNVVDMAVGVIIGGAFGKIVSSLVNNVVTPGLGILIGGVDFKNLEIVLKDAVGEQPAVVIQYGIFLQTIFDFLIVAAAIFAAIKAINTLKKKQEATPATPPAPNKQEVLLEEIRDLLKKQ
jgi:large conductance mechanosensitive channel